MSSHLRRRRTFLKKIQRAGCRIDAPHGGRLSITSKARNFDFLKHFAGFIVNPAGIKSFLLLFFKKEPLSFVHRFPVALRAGLEELPRARNDSNTKGRYP
jgi:hypothetical protein